MSPGRLLRWQSQSLGWSESRWRVTDLWLIFSQPFFFLGSLPFPFICNWLRHTAAEKRLYQDPLLQNDDFCLSAIGGYRSFLLYWRNISPYFPPALDELFSFRIIVSCSCFSKGSGFLPTHPIISLNPLKIFLWILEQAGSVYSHWHSLLLQELCLQPQMFLLWTLLIQKADFILCPWVIIFNNSVVCLYSSVSWRKSSDTIGNSLF